MASRGPDPRELSIGRCARVEMRLLDLDDELQRLLNERREAHAQAAELGMDPPASRHFSRPMEVAIATERGDAFWDREPLHPAPVAIRAAAR